MMVPNTSSIDDSGPLEWFSSDGLISGAVYFLRLLIAVVLIFIPMIAVAMIPKRILYGPAQDTFVYVGIVSLLFGFWLFFASTVKHYRTRGVYMPRFFTIITPFMPLMLLFTWVFSSKERRQQNLRVIEQQQHMRQRVKMERTKASSNEVPKPPSETVSNAAASPVQYARKVGLAKDNPTVRRRR